MDKKRTPKRRVFNLLLGIAFISYGFYRLYTFYQGVPYTTFRLIVACGFVVLGFFDLYVYFKNRKAGKKEDL